MVDFAGWAMPVQYSSIIPEHQAVRQAVGFFDIGHMGRLQFEGADAIRNVERLVTCNLSKMQTGQIRYGLITNDGGGILDDVLVYHCGERAVGLVVNASNREKIVVWSEKHLTDDCRLVDETLKTGMFAVQGPQATHLFGPEINGLKYYRWVETSLYGVPVLVSRTGYTGEDGFEIVVSGDDTETLWCKLFAAAEPLGGMACGLGCRDTLRLEAAMPLYGHELSESIDPISAGLTSSVDFAKDFIGRSALQLVAERGVKRTRIGLTLSGKRAAREGSLVYAGEQCVGEVTSGTFSPTLNGVIAMAYIDRDHAIPGECLQVDLRGRPRTGDRCLTSVL